MHPSKLSEPCDIAGRSSRLDNANSSNSNSKTTLEQKILTENHLFDDEVVPEVGTPPIGPIEGDVNAATNSSSISCQEDSAPGDCNENHASFPATDLSPAAHRSSMTPQAGHVGFFEARLASRVTFAVRNSDLAPEKAPATPPSRRASLAKSIQTFSGGQDSSTPCRATTHAANEENSAKDLADLLIEELGEPIFSDEYWVGTLYRNLRSKAAIIRYLDTSGEFNNDRWTRIPEVIEDERELYDPVCDIVNSILTNLAPPGTANMRNAVNTSTTHFKHESIGTTTSSHFSCPDISIKATGPSFSRPSDGAPLGFSNSAAFLDGKKQLRIKKWHDHLTQLGGYARQVFIQQPNRRFVRALIVTESQARLFHFDRSGAQYSPPFNIHGRDGAVIFVRLILGLCIINEHELGLDDSVQWTLDSQGNQTGGTLRAIGPDNTIVTYELTSIRPYIRTTVRGRGTICWSIKDRDGNEFLVKDYWMSDGRTPEYELLQQTKGTPGIGEMVSYESARAQTKHYRGNFKEYEGEFHNRTSIRIVLKAYGKTIDKFTSAKQFLAAFRDVIAAHHALVKLGLHHRDISPSNILLGLKGAPEGLRGILIDLDMAIGSGRHVTEICQDFRTGTPMFYSLILLKSKYELKLSNPPAHDYLDDMEAFFWIFNFFIFTLKANGEPVKEIKAALQENITLWGDMKMAFGIKWGFISMKGIVKEASAALDESWRYSCWDLFVKFREYMYDLVSEKELMIYDINPPNADGIIENRFSEVLKNVDGHYDYILGLFDAALEKAREEIELPKANIQPRSAVIVSLATARDSTMGPPPPPAAPTPRPRTQSQGKKGPKGSVTASSTAQMRPPPPPAAPRRRTQSQGKAVQPALPQAQPSLPRTRSQTSLRRVEISVGAPPPPPLPSALCQPRTRSYKGKEPLIELPNMIKKRTSRDFLVDEEASEPKRRRQQGGPGPSTLSQSYDMQD
ncbi:hypothetical protein EST38_g6199 [Candolleomyces aberdarensis]|uniref:Fungal-type protein kinase domain-containing protein n=1 Tax=Candolleomyces aberdarensis TaxID=2316362 RepID=A0A4Q2DII8_9AGAR|nr:hypothetical protein EST38_g6199 [Candolleomyces aberdarensis]